jgi:FHS family L-fucose permease-like MFS transporter
MNTTTDQKANRIVPIIMMIALFGMIAFVTNLAAPMGQVLKEQFGASNFQGLLGNAANFIAYAVMGIPGGILLQRVGYKKTALIAIAVGFLGVFVQFLSGHSPQNVAFAVYLLGAFVAGFSMCLLNIVVNPMLNTLGGGGNKGNQLIQVGGSFNSVMATFTPAFVGILIGEAAKANIKDVFPVMYIAMAVFAVVFFVLLAVKIPEPYVTKTKESLKKLMTGALKFRHFVLGAIAIFVYLGVEVGTPYVMLYWLSDNPEVGKTIAGFVAGTYWFLMLIGRLVGASIGGKVSSKAMLGTASFVGMILILLAIFSPTSTLVSLPVLQRSAAGALSFGLAQVPINAMFIVLVGLCTSIMWGGIFNLAVEGLGKYTAAASGIFMTLVVGGGILPAIQGGIADKAGYMASYWLVFICLVYLFYYALIGSKNVNRNISVLDEDEVPIETTPQSLPVED